MKHAIWLSGEHPELSYAELKGAVEAENASIEGVYGRIALIGGKNAELVFPRMGYANRSISVISHGDFEEVKTALGDAELPEGSFAVRAYRYGGFRGKGMDAEREIGEVVSKKRGIDLKNPENILEVYLGREVFAGLKIEDRRRISEREPTKRPFFSPVTLSPRMARALINLARTRRGERLLDPFCGTGAILLEAGLMDITPVGSDFDEKMISGAKENMNFYGITGELHLLDIGEIESIGGINRISTDPPYGRSSRTGREEIGKLYRRSFRAMASALDRGSYLSIILTDMAQTGLAEDFELIEHYSIKVHRSLKRIFCVFRKKD